MKKTVAVILLAAASVAYGQTKVNLKAQTKNADFSQATSVVPFPVGPSLPATCNQGQMFFNSAAPAGTNVYGCVALNTWTQMSGGAASSFNLPLAVQQSSGTTLSIGAGCTSSSPCMARIGSVVYDFSSTGVLTLTGGSGEVFLYVSSTGQLTAGVSTLGNPAVSCSGCQVMTSITQFPPASIPLATWTANNGTWDATGVDSRAILSGAPTLEAGPYISLTQTPGSVTIASGASTSGTCGASTGGTFLYTPGAPGVKDTFAVCAKDASNVFAWRTLY